MSLFFFNDTATTEIYTLSLHDALPIYREGAGAGGAGGGARLRRLAAALPAPAAQDPQQRRDRKSTRLNSSHANISYAVFCLKKKKIIPLRHSHPTIVSNSFSIFRRKHR